MASTSRTRQQKLDYRQEEVSRIMMRWKAAESCSLVGVGSVGKSNLLQHLANPRVQAEYMKLTNTEHFKAILIDPSMLSPLPPQGSADDSQTRCWIGYELMMHRLYMAFYQSNALSDTDKQDLQEAYLRLQDGNNPLYAYMGLRYLELGIDILLRNDMQIVFMFDEFEDMLRTLPIKFFLTLRGLRDANKKRLSYLTFTRSPLMAIVDRLEIDRLEIEEFTELFTDNVFFIGPYNDKDSRRMVDELAARNQQTETIDEYAKTFLLWATGGFAGLLRASFRVLPQMNKDAFNSSTVMTRSEELAKQLAVKQPVQVECETIWNSLSGAEQYILKVAAGIETYDKAKTDPQAAALLQKKNLLNVDDERPSELIITPPLLLYYLQGQ